jgi:hypothetical protein
LQTEQREKGISPALFLWAGPGLGKSQLGQQAATSLGVWAKELKWPEPPQYLDRRLFYHDPSDFKFPLPDMKKRTIEWICSLFPADRNWRGIIMLEELPQAPPLVQNVAAQVALDGMCADYRLPKGAAVFACGNRMQDRSNTHKMGKHLLSRFMHIDLEVSNDDWMAHAIKKNFHPAVRGHMNHWPADLHHFDPTSDDRSFPCPRSWEFISQQLYAAELPETAPGHISQRLLLPVLSGLIGEAYGAKHHGFYKIYRDLPDIEQIVNNPTMAPVPKEPGVMFALASALAEKARKGTDKQLGNILTYSYRVPEEYTILIGRDAIAANFRTMNVPEFTTWGKKFRHLTFPQKKNQPI